MRRGSVRKFLQLAAGLLVASAAFAQYNSAVRPRYEALAPHSYYPFASNLASTPLKQWNGKFTDLLHQNITFTMVGLDPHTSNATTTIPVVIIPIKFVYGASNGNKTFNAAKDTFPNGQTVVQLVENSPLMQSNLDFTEGGVDLGKTQYIDAFQRGNFFSAVKTHTAYHTLLGTPKVGSVLAISVPANLGSVMTNPISGHGLVGTYDFGTLDVKIQAYMASHPGLITPNVLPIFISHDIYLTSGGCCIGGYHGSTAGPPNGQTYAYSTLVDQGTNNFSQDVSALSHEIGEWMDNPFFGTNSVNCQDNSQLEVGDPLENNANFGAFKYTVNGFTYNLQSLVYLGYFGAPRATSVKSCLSFRNEQKTVCPGQ
jgi:hypothetical protein